MQMDGGWISTCGTLPLVMLSVPLALFGSEAGPLGDLIGPIPPLPELLRASPGTLMNLLFLLQQTSGKIRREFERSGKVLKHIFLKRNILVGKDAPRPTKHFTDTKLGEVKGQNYCLLERLHLLCQRYGREGRTVRRS